MTTPRGQNPPAKTSHKGHHPGGSRPKATKPKATKPKAPRPETPKLKVPQPEARRPKAPRPAAPKPEARRPGTPKPKTRKPKTPKPEAPRPEAPKSEAPRPEAPRAEHEDLTESAVRLAQTLLRGVSGAGRELLRVGLGKSEIAPDKRDKRFADPAWQENPVFRAVMQTYLYLGSGVNGVVDNLGIEGVNAERARFALTLVREALAPTNSLLGNPEALKRLVNTRGGSLRHGIANWAGDVRHNRGMPSMVDRRPFRLGENLAATPGAVIHRTEAFELIQYTPQSGTVYQRPMLVVPPQVNKYYALDLAPGRSMIEYLLKQGIQVFCISWRNPTGAQRDWNFDTYAQATIEAIDAVREVTGSPDVNMMGGCLGGITVAIVQAHLAALHDRRVHSATMTVTLLDCESDGPMFLFATPQSLALAKKASLGSGVIDGWETAQVFAWLRPNDLVWNYWVNNYLLGQDPPAFDILAWNADTTRLTSAFHHQMLDLVAGNQLVRPGAMTVLGTPIDISRVACDTYVVAGRTDHITPWHTCYRTTQMVSGRLAIRLVLERPHPDRGGRPEAPAARLLRQSGARRPRPSSGWPVRSGTKAPGGSTGPIGWPTAPVSRSRQLEHTALQPYVTYRCAHRNTKTSREHAFFFFIYLLCFRCPDAAAGVSGAGRSCCGSGSASRRSRRTRGISALPTQRGKRTLFTGR